MNSPAQNQIAQYYQKNQTQEFLSNLKIQVLRPKNSQQDLEDYNILLILRYEDQLADKITLQYQGLPDQSLYQAQIDLYDKMLKTKYDDKDSLQDYQTKILAIINEWHSEINKL